VLIYQGQHSAGSSRANRLVLRAAEATFGQVSRRRCLGVVAKTNEAARFIQARGFAPVQVIPCGYDESRFFPPTRQERDRCRGALGLSSDELALVYAGKLLPVRDVGSAVEALSILRRRGRSVRLLVAGRGPELDALMRKARELEVEARVSFLGLLPWRQLRDLYWAGDVFVFPSLREIFGLVLLEAMACGLPIVSTPVPAAEDTIDDGRNGYLVPPADSAAMAAAVERVLADPGLAASMREAVCGTAGQYAWNVVAQSVIEYASLRVSAMRSEQGRRSMRELRGRQ
jgi:glycosyltransferase involved in cell wall biosynthesis